MNLCRGAAGKFPSCCLYLLLSCNFAWSAKINSTSVVPALVLKDSAFQVLESHCISCHGPEKQKGDLRLDDFDSSDPVELQELFARMSEVVQFREMPPEGSEQPSEVERNTLQRWLGEQLHGEPAKALAEKLKRFEYGNVVSHTDLFSGEYAKVPGSTLDRRWLISEYIFNEKINRLLNYEPTRTIYGVTNPVQGYKGTAVFTGVRKLSMEISSVERLRTPFYYPKKLAYDTTARRHSRPDTFSPWSVTPSGLPGIWPLSQ